MVFFNRKDFEQALPCFKKANKISKFYFGDNHINTAIGYQFLALIFAELGKYENALKYYNLTLRVYKIIGNTKYANKIKKINFFIKKIKKRIQLRQYLYQENILKNFKKNL